MRATTSDSPRFPLMWAAAGLLEAPLLGWLFGAAEGLPAGVLVAGHLAASALMFFAAPKSFGWFHPRRPWGEAAAGWTLLFPGVGWIFAGALWASYTPPLHPHPVFKAEELLPEEEDGGDDTLTPDGRGEQARLIDAADVMPAADILLGADRTLKRSAIDTLAKIRTPEAIAWILKSRKDPDLEVRFFATATLTALKREFESNIRAAEREVVEHPAALDRQVLLHATVAEYALSGLITPDQREGMLRNASRSLAEPAATDDEALRLLFRIECRLDRSAALARLQELQRRIPGEKSRWLREEAGLLFREGRFAEVGAKLKELGVGDIAEDASLEPGQKAAWNSALLWWNDE